MTVAVSKETNIRDIPLDEIKMRFRLRTPKDLKVRELTESIRTIGLLSPITIDNQNYLVCGFHRLSAYKLLGFETIPAITKDYSLLYSELGEIEENLTRSPLSKIEIGKHIEEFDQTFHYGMKDICDLDHFNQLVDWDNSSFYQATNQSSSFIS